jgi:hypothetical protein
LVLTPPQINFDAVGEATGMSADVAEEILEEILENIQKATGVTRATFEPSRANSRRVDDITPGPPILAGSSEYTGSLPVLELTETRRSPESGQNKRRHVDFTEDGDEFYDEEDDYGNAPPMKKRRTAEPTMSGRVYEADYPASVISNVDTQHVESPYGGLGAQMRVHYGIFPTREYIKTQLYMISDLHLPIPSMNHRF